MKEVIEINEALIRACKYIEDCTGDCPLSALEYNMDCDIRCNSNIEYWKCWYDYFRKTKK